MNEYKKVDVQEYVSSLVQSGRAKLFYAVKYGMISVRPGVEGEEIVTWSVDEKGNPIKEKVGTVKIESDTHKPQWVVTKLDDEGNPIIDKNGNKNEWIVNYETLGRKYEVDSENPSLMRPKGSPQLFIQIEDNITLTQWGSEMNIAKGGYINITNPNDMYGISKRDFDDTYRPIEMQENKKIAK